MWAGRSDFRMRGNEVAEVPMHVEQTSLDGMIFLIRGQKVILDSDLAALYGTTTGRLNEQVKRNRLRFPPDFMFQLTRQEVTDLMSQNAISRWGGRRKLPFAFTEQGVAMLSSVLNTDRAIAVNISIMRAFLRLRELLLTHEELSKKHRRIGFTSQ